MEQQIKTFLWLSDTVQSLIDTPLESINISMDDEGESKTVLTVEVPAEEIGKLIGKNGRTAHAIRCLLLARGKRDGRTYVVDVVQPAKAAQ